MSKQELIGIIDAEYEELVSMTRIDRVNYLTEGFDADEKDAAEALSTFGL